VTPLVVPWLRLAAVRVQEERVALSDLDAAIGDGDHGYNLARGFATIAADLAGGGYAGLTTATALRRAGATITGTVGGASGALYGRALLRAGEALDLAGVQAQPTGSPVARAALAIEAATQAIAALGRSALGQKTMLDALVPAAQVLTRWAASEGRPNPPDAPPAELALALALAEAAAAAETGAAATESLLAQRGRASYLGERSRGHIDPGATSAALLLRALADVAAA
jgi:phosphoenolpyruvate---glycerone phosphotransferase subunit DhaL